MPNPLILLEQHSAADARTFITKNAQSLKDMGYTKFLLEMNQEVSASQFKSQCLQIEKMAHVPQLIKKSTKALYILLIELEKQGIDYEFIDPESQQEAARQNDLLTQANQTSTYAYQQAEQRRNQLVAARDAVMTQKIINESQKHNGGVIYLGGFLHQKLVHILSKSEINCRFLMFANSNTEKQTYLSNVSSPHDSSWANFYNPLKRQNYYQTHVNHFDLAVEHNLSFELIQSSCELTELTELTLGDNAPMVSEYFNEVLPGWQHNRDEKFVIKATKRSNEVLADVYNVGRSFPGIKLFVSKEDHNRYKLSIPGLNLSDNKEALQKTLVEKNIMQAPTKK